MDAVRAQLDGLAATYERLLAQVEGLLEENGSLKRELRAAARLGESEDGEQADDSPTPPTPKVGCNKRGETVARSGSGGSGLMVDTGASQGVHREVAVSAAQTVELMVFWEDDPQVAPQSDGIALRSPGTFHSFPVSEESRQPAHHQGEMFRDDSCLQRFVAAPSDRARVVWDLISIIVLAYDLIMLPLVVFGDPKHTIFFVAKTITTSVWLIDIVASCLLGYYVKGRLEMRPRKIRVNYLKHGFLLDISLSTLDVLELVVLLQQVDVFSALRLGKVSRLFRVLRLLRLVRLAKVSGSIKRSIDRVKLDSLRTVMNVVQLLIAIAYLNHFIACGWYGIGISDLMGAQWPTWVKQLKLKDDASPDRAELYFYTTALHWALTQCTPASMEVVPRNSLERCYTIMVVLLGMVMFSSLISSVTAVMTKFRERNRERSIQRETLSEYLSNNRVSLDLGNQVLAFLQHRGFSTSKRPIDGDIPALHRLPEKLRKRLHGEVYTPILKKHPLFACLDQLYSFGILAVCHMAMTQAIVPDGHRLFHFGEDARKMYFVTHGAMEYFAGMTEMAAATALVRDKSAGGGYISEACLWVEAWRHRGRLVAERDAEVAQLDAQAFSGVVRNTDALHHCRKYAQMFCSKLQGMAMESLTDVCCTADQLSEIVNEVFGDMFKAPSSNSMQRDTSGIFGYLQRAS